MSRAVKMCNHRISLQEIRPSSGSFVMLDFFAPVATNHTAAIALGTNTCVRREGKHHILGVWA